MISATFPGAPNPEPKFNILERAALADVDRFLEAGPTPILTNNEDDLTIISDSLYFDAISRRSTPRDAMRRVAEGSLTDEDIEASRRAGRAIARREKSEMYADRLMTAGAATDTCRSLMWIATKAQFVPVREDDTVATVTHRVGDYVTDLLTGARERRILRGAAMDRVTWTIREKFDEDPGSQLALTALAGKNSRRKMDFWLGHLSKTSRGFERLDGPTRRRLVDYALTRPAEFLEKPNLVQMIANLAGKAA